MEENSVSVSSAPAQPMSQAVGSVYDRIMMANEGWYS